MLFSLLVSAITASGGGRAREAGELVRNAQLRACAAGGIDQALFHVLDQGTAHWPADGVARPLRGDGCALRVSVASQDGKINPNIASAALLSGLFQAAGVDAHQAPSIAAAVVAWRFPIAQTEVPRGTDYKPPGAPFQSLAEIGLVPGVTPALLERIAPALTLYHDGDPNLLDASPLVRRAVFLGSGVDPDGDEGPSAAQGPAAPSGERFDPSVVEVIVEASDRNGHRARQDVIAVTGAGAGRDAGGAAAPFKIVAMGAS
ncbi:general secretion pathway protein GspK [Acetobacteraceae bacterium KSS8]|uniref:General secretion pathway protein GspK n=1 Tax=Endosaccharibacter trunci TaxID=2812733 RepID=A0ABT1W995_9PROT|nr:general secretion pathway protein GspK [Acetobacteraceae bacterium KSS8]